MRSSYRTNNFSLLFTQTVLLQRPRIIVDVGILDGYSTVHLATAAKHINLTMKKECHVYSYDLFEGYRYKHGNRECVENNLERFELSDYVILRQKDAFKAHEDFKDGEVCLLHLDVSNDGDKIKNLLELWNPKMNPCYGIILLEGGSEERDNIQWMIEYNKPPIRKELFSNEIIKNEYNMFIYNQFPSITMLTKTRGEKHECV